jgi:phosphatidylserine/phosphatidylglycerophosphate/cardiolipin synthase-like enzyme
MPSLDQLKAKWFLPMAGDVLGVPQGRATEGGSGPQLSVSTDGNTVEMLIDGKAYMKRWHDEMTKLSRAAGAEAYHAGWRLEAVYPLGYQTPPIPPTALEDMDAAHTGGAAVYPLLSMHIGAVVTNRVTMDSLQLQYFISRACLDARFPPAGSNHQKMVVFKTSGAGTAVLGSVDISKTRWDDSTHASTVAGRDPEGKPTHDTGVAIIGPAVADLDICFRERWNDSSRTFGMGPLWQPLITTPVASPPVGGTHSVQVLRIFGITRVLSGYTWSPRGEFTVWASYLNAIRAAARYIYIEDQYFLPWDYPPRFSRPAGPGRDVDIVYQLGEAMKRGVNVVVLTPSNAEDAWHHYQKYQRDLGVNYLSSVRTAGSPGDIVVASLQNGTSDVYVHSKLMLVDDELLLIGSANVGQRSMTYDGEVHVGIVDAAETLPREFRKTLWAEHMGRAAGALDDPAAAFALFKDDTGASAGHLKPYPFDKLAVFPVGPGTTGPPIGHGRVLRNGIDPYAGPPALA